MTEHTQNGWPEYKKLFEQQMQTTKEIQEQVTQCRVEIAGLKARARVWGFVAGLIPSSIIAAVTLYTLIIGGK